MKKLFYPEKGDQVLLLGGLSGTLLKTESGSVQFLSPIDGGVWTAAYTVLIQPHGDGEPSERVDFAKIVWWPRHKRWRELDPHDVNRIFKEDAERDK